VDGFSVKTKTAIEKYFEKADKRRFSSKPPQIRNYGSHDKRENGLAA
jgi:hypothetical protein